MNPNPLTEADFDHLEELLEADVFGGDAMRLDEAQATLCAIVSNPDPIPPAVWLPEVLGEGVNTQVRKRCNPVIWPGVLPPRQKTCRIRRPVFQRRWAARMHRPWPGSPHWMT